MSRGISLFRDVLAEFEALRCPVITILTQSIVACETQFWVMKLLSVILIGKYILTFVRVDICTCPQGSHDRISCRACETDAK
eukprot:CFRG8566T1